MNSAINGGSGALPIDDLPQFDVGGLLQAALRQIDSADRSVVSSAVVEAARREIVAILASRLEEGGERAHATEQQTLRRMARSLMPVKDHRVESARLTLMSAADMLRTSMRSPQQPADSPEEPRPENPKVDSAEFPAG